jgi:hypothetical protein
MWSSTYKLNIDSINKSFSIILQDNDITIRRLEYSGSGPLSYDKKSEAHYWYLFGSDGTRLKEWSTLTELLLNPNPSVISVWGRSGVGKSTLVRKIFSRLVLDGRYQAFSWVDVPHPFDLPDFSWHLLLDFQSTHEEKVAAAAGLMKGQDPIQACREILNEKQYIVVIDGLQSKQDWDIIRKTFFSELHTSRGSHIIVITNEKSVAKHSVDDKKDQLLKVKHLRDGDSIGLPLVKVCLLDPLVFDLTIIFERLVSLDLHFFSKSIGIITLESYIVVRYHNLGI